MKIIFYLFLVFYFLYTLSFALKFNKTDIYYSHKQRIIHNIMIWIIPFLWITVLKTINTPLKPSIFKNEIDNHDTGWWTFGFFSLFHGGFSSGNQHSEYTSVWKENYENYDSGSDTDLTFSE